MAIFPLENLVFETGTAGGAAADDIEIKIPIKSFELADEQIKTSLDLECIELPSADLKELIGKTFEFPKNPDEGYIEGSIYMQSAHHPVDATRIAFLETRDDKILVELDLEFIFEFERLANEDDEAYENVKLTEKFWLAI